jgi:seryl-tRNA synthetase
VAEFRPGTPTQAEFLGDLLERDLLVDSGVPGLYGRGPGFEHVRLAFDRLVTEAAVPDSPESYRFPPLLPRRQLESIGYLKSFPHLAGSVFGFEGDEADAGEMQALAESHADWSKFQEMTDLVLVPAACYPVYPMVADRDPLAPGGVMVDAGASYVFRHEPSGDPARLQMFHQRELVRIGEPDTVREWRDTWRDRALELLGGLGLDVASDIASDPFFGRTGRFLAKSQKEQALKFELCAPIAGDEPTALASFNYHEEHFTSTYGIEMADGGVAHTACLGFGEERVTLALLKRHGFELGEWPDEVRERLWPR